jgi:hypothetical protein
VKIENWRRSRAAGFRLVQPEIFNLQSPISNLFRTAVRHQDSVNKPDNYGWIFDFASGDYRYLCLTLEIANSTCEHR